jgi:hypothetical protein
VGFRLRAGGTNLALLVLLIGALVTGGLTFAIGGAWAFWALAAHGAVGLALVLLAPWKSVISARGLRRARSGTAASMLLAVLIVITVASGIAHAMGWWAGGLAMQVHVGGALLSIPLAVWHVVARPVRPRPSDLSRRSLLRAGAVVGGGIVAFGAIARASCARPAFAVQNAGRPAPTSEARSILRRCLTRSGWTTRLPRSTRPIGA